MIPTIGLIASPPIARFVRDLESDLTDRCRILYLTAAKSDDVLRLYQESLNEVDIFLFSGRLFYLTLLEQGVYPAKNFYIFNEFEGDLKGMLLSLLLKDRSFDFSRVFIDVAIPQNEYLGIREIFDRNQMPLYSEGVDLFNRRDYGRQLLNLHMDLHERGIIDLSITGVGTLTQELEAHNIPYRYFYPTKEYVIHFIMQILSSRPVELEYTPSAILIRPERMDQGLKTLCSRKMHEIAAEKQINCSSSHEHDGVLIQMRLSELLRLTDGFRDLSFKKHIEASSGAVSLGFGSGKNPFQARLNANTALSTGLTQSGESYYASVDNELIGPLGVDHIESYQNRPDEHILKMSKQYHVNHQNIQKILNFTSLIESETFSAQELAEFMGITIRSASRLMNRVIEHGGAESYIDKTRKGKGRPVKLYRLIW